MCFMELTFQMSKTFLIMGGHCFSSGPGNVDFDTIYEFDNQNYDWILRKDKLETERHGFVAIPLPNSWDVC